MTEPSFPKTWNKESKPHKFCPGCGQALALKVLGAVIDDMGIQDKVVFATDIGCSLLAWDFYNLDTVQTHHGRTMPLITGLKMAKPEAIVIGFIGDGGGYAIGAQHLVNCAMRNDKITVILINNANYAMTGGQLSPTTLLEQKTETTPLGRTIAQGKPFHGPEMVAQIAQEGAYVARTISNDYEGSKSVLKNAIQNQIDGRGFSFVEILAMCPVNWHTNASETIEYVEKTMATEYKIGEIKCLPK